MWYRKFVGLLVFLFLGLIPLAVRAQDTPEPNYLVYFTPQVTPEERQKWMSDHCAEEISSIPQIFMAEVKFSTNCGISIKSAKIAGGIVTSIEQDVVVHGTAVITDPFILGYDTRYAWDQIDAQGAWNLTTGISDVVIAFVDSGIDMSHTEFSGRILPGYDFINGDNNPEDDEGHGTSVTGIGAAAADGAGIAGMCPRCSILPMKVLGANNMGTWKSVSAGIVAATDQGVDVINLSLGAEVTTTALISAVAYAIDHGVVVIAAAGNNASDKPYYPAALPGVVGVGGTDQKDTHWPIANHGEFVDIVAPAVVYTTERRGGYGFEAGTSLSTPFVSGVAGLIKSLRPDLTAPEIIEILETQAADLGDPGWDPYYGWGRLDAHKALVAANYGQDIPVPLYLPYINPGD